MNLLFIPLLSLYYSHLHLHSYNETGAGTADLAVEASHYNFLNASAGIKFVYDYQFFESYLTTIQPEVHTLVFYELSDDRMEVTAEFTGGGPSFITKGFNPARGGLNVGGSINVFRQTGIVLSAEYDFKLKEDYYANAGFLRFRYEW